MDRRMSPHGQTQMLYDLLERVGNDGFLNEVDERQQKAGDTLLGFVTDIFEMGNHKLRMSSIDTFK